MMIVLDIVVAVLVGWLGGVVVNMLADELPYRRSPALPVYPDGTPRPMMAWSGIVAFLLGKRAPDVPRPDETRTRMGNERLSWRYVLTEIGTILIMVVTVLNAPNITGIQPLQTLFYMVYVLIFALIIVIDVEHKLILFVVIIPSALLAMLNALIVPIPEPNILNALAGGAMGFGVFFVMYQGGFLFTYIMGKVRGETINTVAFGYGDVMMITVSGLMLGLVNTIMAIFITVFLGALGALIYIILRSLLRGRYQLFTALPYGPYIVVATYLMLIFGEPIRMGWVGY